MTARLAIAVLGLAACTVGDGFEIQPGPDAEPDPSMPPQVLTVDGAILDYFVLQHIPSAAVETVGLADERSVTADASGDYFLVDVPAAGLFRARVIPATSTDLCTVNDAIEVGDVSVTENLFVLSAADVARQHTTAGLVRAPGAGMVIVDLRDAQGNPAEGVPASAIRMVPDAGGAALTPYFFGAYGDVDPAMTSSQQQGGKARVAFLNVTAGALTLHVDAQAGSAVVPVTVEPDSVTLARATVSAPTAPTTVSFVTDIYPSLQTATKGGVGCANCHTSGGYAGQLPFDGAIGDTYRTIMAAGVIAPGAPASSLLLTKPLYEVPANHPNATWLSTSDPGYQRTLAWIEQGATF